jgi:hypothetical protein
MRIIDPPLKIDPVIPPVEMTNGHRVRGRSIDASARQPGTGTGSAVGSVSPGSRAR